MLPKEVCSACTTFAAAARDSNQRITMAKSSLIPAVTKALYCMLIPLSASCSGPNDRHSTITIRPPPIRLNECDDDPFASLHHCSDWLMADLIAAPTEICRLIRNLCAGSAEGQDRIRECGVLKYLLFLIEISSAPSIMQQVDDDSLLSFRRATLQAIGNSVASCQSNKAEIWSEGWPHPIIDTFSQEFPTDCKAISSMIIYNCLLGNSKTLEDFAHSEDGSVAIESMLRTMYRPGAGVESAKEQAARREMMTWAELIIKLLITDGNLIPLHQRLGVRKTESSTGSELVETLLWYVVEDLVSDSKDENGMDTPGLTLRDADCAYLANEFALILNICKQGALAQRPPSAEADDTKRLANCLMQLVQVIATMTTREDANIRRAMRERGLLANVVQLLASIIAGEQQHQQQSSATRAAQSAAEAVAPRLGEERGLKRDLVRVIANMCYADRASQDQVRELGGIPYVLACSGVDENNPYSREWSVLAVRNLCDNNLENQKVIEKLKPMSVAPLPEELRRQGVRADLDPSGKVRLTGPPRPPNTSPSSPAASAAGSSSAAASIAAAADADAGGGGVGSSGRPSADTAAAAAAAAAAGTAAERAQEEMVSELRGMGLHVTVDPDTGLIDMTHPSAVPSKFTYPGPPPPPPPGAGSP